MMPRYGGQGWWGPPQPEDDGLQSRLQAGSNGLQDRQGVRSQRDLSSCQN